MIMHRFAKWAFVTVCTLAAGCASRTARESGSPVDHDDARIAQVYFWRAKPGMLAEYNKYIRDVAEPIDREAQRADAFIAVTTYAANDTTLPWTHMRVFLLRDSTQLRGLSAALGAAGARLEPDSARRRQQGEYSATLRDRVGATVMEIVR
jgi:hypothetical protein